MPVVGRQRVFSRNSILFSVVTIRIRCLLIPSIKVPAVGHVIQLVASHSIDSGRILIAIGYIRLNHRLRLVIIILCPLLFPIPRDNFRS